jgi:hypothetical protein
MEGVVGRHQTPPPPFGKRKNAEASIIPLVFYFDI